MKDLKNLKGAKMLSKMEQKGIFGGRIACESEYDCPPGQCCLGTMYPVGTYCGLPNSDDNLCQPGEIT